jgi:ATP-dependent Lhr-like helicase
VLTDVRTEQVRGAGLEHILAQASIQHDAEEMMDGVRAAVTRSSK